MSRERRVAFQFGEQIQGLIDCLADVSDKKTLALSVREEDSRTGDPSVKHYRIRRLDNGGYYISPQKPFADLFALIDYYSRQSLCFFFALNCLLKDNVQYRQNRKKRLFFSLRAAYLSNGRLYRLLRNNLKIL